MQLLDGVFASAQRFELGLDLGVVGHRLFDLLDLGGNLGVLAHLFGELVPFDLVHEKEEHDLGNHDAQDNEQPPLVGLGAALRLALLREQVDANQARFSLSFRIDNPSATASCGPSEAS